MKILLAVLLSVALYAITASPAWAEETPPTVPPGPKPPGDTIPGMKCTTDSNGHTVCTIPKKQQ